MTWKIKTDEEGKPVIDGTKITFVDPEGKDLPLDPVQMYAKITQLGKENQKHRETAQGIADKYKLFDGIEDIEAWKTEADNAITTVANFNDKDWMKAEKVESLKRDMLDSFEKKEKAAKDAFLDKEKGFLTVIEQKDQTIRTLLVSNKFANSPYFSGDNRKTNLLPDIAESYFGRHFKVEEDQKTKQPVVVAYYDNGEEVNSKVNPGERADFDEAIGLIIEKHPKKDYFLKSTPGGSSATGGSGGEDDEKDEIQKLEAQLAQAQKDSDARKMITLRRLLHEARLRKNARAA